MEKLDTKKKSKYIQGIGEIKCQEQRKQRKQQQNL
jgi:hypothetical protein